MERRDPTTDVDDITLTDDQLALLDHRAAELDADPSIALSEEQFIAQVRAKWL